MPPHAAGPWRHHFAQAIWAQTRLSQQSRKALVAIYEQLLAASQVNNYAIPLG